MSKGKLALKVTKVKPLRITVGKDIVLRVARLPCGNAEIIIEADRSIEIRKQVDNEAIERLAEMKRKKNAKNKAKFKQLAKGLYT